MLLVPWRGTLATDEVLYGSGRTPAHSLLVRGILVFGILSGLFLILERGWLSLWPRALSPTVEVVPRRYQKTPPGRSSIHSRSSIYVSEDGVHNPLERSRCRANFKGHCFQLVEAIRRDRGRLLSVSCVDFDTQVAELGRALDLQFEGPRI